MICISIAQESRRLALADMLNASRQGDLIDLQLDRFESAPDINELLTHKPKPIILSCRRLQDGGAWRGTEESRLALLRQCIISKADYVEIELDIAHQVGRFPPAKRVITYTNLQETPANIAEIYAQAQTKRPDVIKLATLARSPEEAWPLLQILAKPALPTVVVGLGKPGVMLSVLGRKIGAPWIYAALERGMEAYPGQATIHDLREVYHYHAIERTTRFIGVAGFSEREYVTVAVLNAALAHLGLPMRCLPVALGSIPQFRLVMAAVQLAGVVVDEQHRVSILDLATELSPTAKAAHAADLLVPKGGKWMAFNPSCQAAIIALEAMLRTKAPVDKLLQDRVVLIVGTNASARSAAYGVQQRRGVVILASQQREAAQQLAQSLGCRDIPFEALYTTMHDVLIVCDHEKKPGDAGAEPGEAGINAGYLRPGMTVMDLTTATRLSPLLRSARASGCTIVTPRQVLHEQLMLQVRLLTGQEVPRELVEEKLSTLLYD
jgi:3-dehydroquinate dehydratase/shikimate dehydrogenase